MLVVPLEHPACQEVALAGGKAASLSRLTRDYPVPPGFCVTTQAYARWAEAASPAGMPDEIRDLVATAYSNLAEASGTAALRVAVRSSAIGEDGHSASFAGQYASYLNVSGLDLVAAAVTRCWSSAQAERVQAYQHRHGQEIGVQPVAVLVQQLVAADMAFVAFSAHPVTGQNDEVVINANFGLGESIVNGSVVPDTYLVRKADWTVTTQTIAEKERMTVMRPEGVQEVNVPRLLRQEITLTAAQAGTIARLVTRLENEMHFPVDIEGAFQGGKLYLLQCRPIAASAAEDQ